MIFSALLVVSVCFVKLDIFLLEANKVNEDNSSEPKYMEFPFKVSWRQWPPLSTYYKSINFSNLTNIRIKELDYK